MEGQGDCTGECTWLSFYKKKKEKSSHYKDMFYLVCNLQVAQAQPGSVAVDICLCCTRYQERRGYCLQVSYKHLPKVAEISCGITLV